MTVKTLNIRMLLTWSVCPCLLLEYGCYKGGSMKSEVRIPPRTDRRKKEQLSYLSHLWVQTLPQSAPVNIMQDAPMSTSLLDSCRLRRRPCKTPRPTPLSSAEHFTFSVTELKLSYQWYTHAFDDSPFFLSASFLESVAPDSPAGLFFTLLFGSLDFVGLVFIFYL